jgi:hypothetical protein
VDTVAPVALVADETSEEHSMVPENSNTTQNETTFL